MFPSDSSKKLSGERKYFSLYFIGRGEIVMGRKYLKTYEPMSLECSFCGKTVPRDETLFTRDCNGIPFRRVCCNCWEEIMGELGFDGEYYTAADECLDYDY